MADLAKEQVTRRILSTSDEVRSAVIDITRHADPMRAMKSGNQFVNMGRRLNSYIEFRNVKEEFRGHEEAFYIADDSAQVYRIDGKRWEGMSDTNEPAVARKYLAKFDELWQACEIEPTLRQAHL